MRCFIAVDVGDEIKEQMGEIQSKFAEQADIRKKDVKWVQAEGIHLTLKFIGEISEDDVVDVCKIVEKVAKQYKGFNLDVEGVGFFGKKAARVLWVGTGKGSEKLGEIQSHIEKELSEAGFPQERRKFHSHLTLGRVKNSKAGYKLAELTEKSEFQDLELGQVPIDSVKVYESKLGPKGAKYFVLADYQFGK